MKLYSSDCGSPASLLNPASPNSAKRSPRTGPTSPSIKPLRAFALEIARDNRDARLANPCPAHDTTFDIRFQEAPYEQRIQSPDV